MIYEKLKFDSTFKFGDLMELSPSSVAYVQYQNPKLDKWMIDAIASDMPVKYYKNPLADSLDSIKNSLTQIKDCSDPDNISRTYLYKNELFDAMKTAISSTDLFITHTNCISGVETSKDPKKPDLNTALMVGQEMLVLTNAVDNISDNSPMLGCFSSLYVKDNIDEYIKPINAFLTQIKDFISDKTELSVNEINSFIISTVENYVKLIDGRRTKDEQFFENSVNIYRKYQEVKRFKHLGSLHKKLIKDSIGTEYLTKNLF